MNGPLHTLPCGFYKKALGSRLTSAVLLYPRGVMKSRNIAGHSSSVYIGVVDLSSKSDRESNASWRNVAVSPDRTVSTSVDGMMAIFMAKWC